MQVQDLFERLSFGELSTLSIGLEGAGGVPAKDQPRVISHTNTALTALYSRFLLKRNFLTLELQEDIKTYHLHSDYAVSNDDPANDNPRYILDSVGEPLKDDLLKILSVKRLDDPETPRCDESMEFPTNIRDLDFAVQITSYDTLRFDAPVDGAKILIEYQANHARLPRNASPLDKISLVPLLEEALLVRVAAGIFLSMGGEIHDAQGTRLLNRYETLCALTDINDLSQESGSNYVNTLTARGFI